MNTESQEVIESGKEIIQSYKLTTIRNNFGLYAQRALLRIVEAAQCEVEGLSFKDKADIRKIPVAETDLFGNKTFSFDLRSICPEGVTHFSQLRQDMLELMDLKYEYDTDVKWVTYALLTKIKADKGKWTIEFEISSEFWTVFLDFSKGFRRFEIEKAMKFRSVHSLRLFQLLSGLKEPISYDISELRKMFGLEKKYENTSMFIHRVIEKAKQEFDAIASFTFEYEVNKRTDGPGRPAVSSITFKPIRRIRITNENDFADVKDRLPVCDLIGRKEYELLTSDWFGFKDKEIKNNLNLLLVAKKKFKLEPFLQKLRIPASRAKNPRGYVIAAIKKELKESFGLILSSSSSKEKNKVV